MSAIDKLVENLKRSSESIRQTQIRFVECVSVDWESRTMTAKGTGDDTEYIDVTLGFGYMDIKPAIGTICLIGIIDGQEVVTFLINAEEVEQVEIKAGSIIYNNGQNAGISNTPELTRRINVLENDLNALKQLFAIWIPVQSDGGAALKSVIVAWAGQRIPLTKQTEIEDSKIKH